MARFKGGRSVGPGSSHSIRTVFRGGRSATDDVTHVLYGLTYFDETDDEQMPRMLREVDWEAVKSDLRAWIKA